MVSYTLSPNANATSPTLSKTSGTRKTENVRDSVILRLNSKYGFFKIAGHK